ncbi:MAG: methyltransferase [Bacteroidetes bacterium GWF2_40_14]|nr:MAG: methyltransferase [Bacteroidetes bacterium GWF2_40_14]
MSNKNILTPLKKYLWGSVPYLFFRLVNSKLDKHKYFRFIKVNGYTHYPYDYAQHYLDMEVNVMTDENNGLPYIRHRGTKNLYFPRHYTHNQIIKGYRSLMIEQDINSPHHYVDSIQEFDGKTLLDIGSAEGLTSLDAIELVDSLFLFEYNPGWIEALEATFEPWKHKVQIMKQYIGDNNIGINQTLDDFLKDKPKKNIFLKMDIEGVERNALAGAVNLFSNADNLHFAICTYHRKSDNKVISTILDKYNCTHSQRDGLLYYKHHLRPCLIRGWAHRDA